MSTDVPASLDVSLGRATEHLAASHLSTSRSSVTLSVCEYRESQTTETRVQIKFQHILKELKASGAIGTIVPT